MFKLFNKSDNVLDWDSAKELIEKNKDKIRWSYDTITLEWAEILSTYKWHEIQLHLKTLNNTVAKELAKFDWEENFVWPCSLYLEVSNWTEDTIEALSEFQGNLTIYNIKNLDRKFSKAFSKFHWYRLWFLWLNKIDEEVADKLSESKVKELRLTLNRNKINREVAESLAKFKWEELRLERIENLENLDESIAKELAKFNWKHLILGWVKKIDNEYIARELAKFNWEFLHLDWSTTLSINAFKELNECKWFQNWLGKYV